MADDEIKSSKSKDYPLRFQIVSDPKIVNLETGQAQELPDPASFQPGDLESTDDAVASATSLVVTGSIGHFIFGTDQLDESHPLWPLFVPKERRFILRFNPALMLDPEKISELVGRHIGLNDQTFLIEMIDPESGDWTLLYVEGQKGDSHAGQ